MNRNVNSTDDIRWLTIELKKPSGSLLAQ